MLMAKNRHGSKHRGAVKLGRMQRIRRRLRIWNRKKTIIGRK